MSHIPIPTYAVDVDKLVHQVQDLKAENATLRAQLAALVKVYMLVEEGTLVRDTSHDHEAGWALRQIPLVQTLAEAKKIVDAYQQQKAK
jgi:hypothetical protein